LAECHTIIANYDEFVNKCFTGRNLDRREQMRSLFKAWSELYTAIMHVNDALPLPAQALELERQAVTYYDLWLQVFPESSVGLYLHVLVDHLREQVERFGALSKYSCQGTANIVLQFSKTT
jgi:hypothetical protein